MVTWTLYYEVLVLEIIIDQSVFPCLVELRAGTILFACRIRDIETQTMVTIRMASISHSFVVLYGHGPRKMPFGFIVHSYVSSFVFSQHESPQSLNVTQHFLSARCVRVHLRN